LLSSVGIRQKAESRRQKEKIFFWKLMNSAFDFSELILKYIDFPSSFFLLPSSFFLLPSSFFLPSGI